MSNEIKFNLRSITKGYVPAEMRFNEYTGDYELCYIAHDKHGNENIFFACEFMASNHEIFDGVMSNTNISAYVLKFQNDCTEAAQIWIMF